MIEFDEFFHKGLKNLEDQGRLRVNRPLQRLKPGLVRCMRSGRELIDFSSSDYLGLSMHPLLLERAMTYARADGCGSGASRIVSGMTSHMYALEQRVAELTSLPEARIFPSGWQANASLLPALVRLSLQQTGEMATIFADKLIHASLYHGCAAAGLQPVRFRHGDITHLASLLARHKRNGLRVILTESVFSMEGDCCDCIALQALAREHHALLCVDEAHAIGILGENGRGLVCDSADIIIGTFSKALGSMGAFIAASKSACAWLDNVASGAVFSTALSPFIVGAVDAALDLLPRMEQERRHVTVLAERFRRHMREAEVNVGTSTTQIIPVVVGKEQEAMTLARAVEEAGFLVVPIRPPTVPPGSCRLRVVVCAHHRVEQIDALAYAILRAKKDISRAIC
ncbi:MAG: 8-amino-7-oxononanoate synthase [Acetobacter sp.]|nr:8-amino-7-oxononanoate synthase [Acetobacter sp.]